MNMKMTLITGIYSSSQNCWYLLVGDGYVELVFLSSFHLGGFHSIRSLTSTKPCLDWATIPASTSIK